jgi:acetyl esterase/lipase
VREIRYRSGEFELKAWVYAPPEADGTLSPALVYLHPGIGSAGSAWIRDTKPFIQAGFIVMLPTFRGEMGNPGHHEFVLGEVDDAKAAIAWLAEQPIVDRNRIYAFGWSYGGFISAMLSLFDDIPLRHSGSIGGLLSPVLFDKWARLGWALPFDGSDAKEGELRSLVGNVQWMKRRHYAYMGSADSEYVPAIVAAKREIAYGPSQLEIVMVPGEHFGSAAPGITRYLDVITREQNGSTRPES